MAYATPADLVKRYDAREIAQLASDSNEPVANINTDSKVLMTLDDASGDIDSALLVGGRYQASQLAGLSGNSLSLLQRMTCELAMTYLMERRPNLDADKLERYQRMRDRHLERLRKGENIFGLDGQIEAGKPQYQRVSSMKTRNLNLIRANAEGTYYPRRRDPRLGG